MKLILERDRTAALWIGLGLVLLLPALAGGYSTLAGWPQAILVITLCFGLQLTDPVHRQRLPGWYLILVAGLAILGLIWLLPGESLLILSPNRRNWPGPDGQVSGIAADRTGTRESLLLALGFCTSLGLGLMYSTGQIRRILLIRLMLASVALVAIVALGVHFVHAPYILLPDVTVLHWDRLSIPFTGANLAAAFFISSVPFGVGSVLVFSAEERYLPVRRVWQLLGLLAIFVLLALQLMTHNRAMWLALMPIVLLGLIYVVTRHRRFRQRLQSLGIALLLLILLGVGLSFFDPGKTIYRFVLLTGDDNSAITRTLLWQNAWNTFREYPGVGIGLGSFGEVSPTTAPPGVSLWARYAHSEPMQWLAETGTAGVALLLVVGASMLKDGARIFRRYRHGLGDRLPFFGAVLLLMLGACVDFPLRCPAILLLTGLYIGVMFGRDPQPPALKTADGTSPEAARTKWPALVLGVGILLAAVGFVPTVWNLTQQGQALAHFEAEKRRYATDQDLVSYASAAESLLEASHGQSRWSGEALRILIGASYSSSQLERWSEPAAAVLAECPYHDSLYYYEALVAFRHLDYARPAELNAQDLALAVTFNTRARACAATSTDTLRRIVTLDFALAGSTLDPDLRALRLAHAQASARWLLTIDPHSTEGLADFLHENHFPFDDLPPCFPTGFSQVEDISAACLAWDRPLTGQHFLNDNSANLITPDQGPPTVGWPQVHLLLATGRAAEAQQLLIARFHSLQMEQRHQVIHEALVNAWGILSRDQWDAVIREIEQSGPTANDRCQLGWVFYNRTQWDLAEHQWRRSYDISHSAAACSALAYLYGNVRSWQFAADFALKWTDLDAQNPQAWRYYALTEFRNKNFSAAKIAFARYRSLAPNQAAADYQLGGEINLGVESADPAPPKRP